MLTSKQRSILKGIAQTEDTIFQLGKGGINDNFISQIDNALRAREIVKLKVLDNSMLSAGEAAVELAEATNSQVVQTIGNKLVLFRRNPEDPKIDLGDLPKKKPKVVKPVKKVLTKPYQSKKKQTRSYGNKY